MVIGDFDLVGVANFPVKTDSPLIIDSDALGVSTSDGHATNSGMYGHGVRTGTERLIPCPRDQEIFTSNWRGSGCPLRIRCEIVKHGAIARRGTDYFELRFLPSSKKLLRVVPTAR